MTRRRSPRPGTAAARGFTLIELMVALGMALGVTAAALGVLLTVLETQRSGFIRVQLQRDAQLTVDMLEYDLNYLGVGIPRGFARQNDGTYTNPGTGTPSADGSSTDEANAAPYQLRPVVRIGTATTLAFLGDLPYPNADTNGIMEPTAFSSNDTHRIAVVSDLAPCSPPDSAGGGSGNYLCNTASESVVPLGGGAPCGGSNDDEPTCPWSMNKYLPTKTSGSKQIPVVVGDVGGGWYLRWWDFGTSNNKDRLMIHFQHDQAAWDTDEDLPEDYFRSNRFGGGHLATMDRVFWKVTDQAGTSACTFGNGDCTVWRRQCWGWAGTGSSDPAEATFPAVGSTAFNGGLADPVDCIAGTGSGTVVEGEGTPWEQIADGVDQFSFTYFDALGNALAAPLDAARASRARSIGVSITVENDTINANAPLQVSLSRRFFLENAGGIVTGAEGHDLDPTPEANGGCWLTTPAGAPPNECSPQ